jgi:hypothetical protein
MSRDLRRIELVARHPRGAPARVALQEAAPRAQLPEHDPERVEIDPRVARVAVGHLGRHVAGLREDHAGYGVTAAVLPARRAEIDDLHLAREADHHVLRRQIAVHDRERAPARVLALVHVAEALGDEARERRRVGPREAVPHLHGALRAARRGCAPRRARRPRTARRLIVDRGVEHLRHARVRELRLHPRLVEEASVKLGSFLCSRRMILTITGRSAPSIPVVVPRKTSPMPPRAMRLRSR